MKKLSVMRPKAPIHLRVKVVNEDTDHVMSDGTYTFTDGSELVVYIKGYIEWRTERMELNGNVRDEA